MNNREIGTRYEGIAMEYLVKKGYIELGRNYYSRYGELDLICKDVEKEEIVFVEVKYRKDSSHGSGLESVTRSKQRKLVKTAMIYLKDKRIKDIPYRFDIISILGSEIEHIENAIWGDYL
ncbi:MAG: YraN family protein [Psychrilyobacter sp.]|nr:YraN family protein [Psychrilyobacter sp.]